MSLFFGKEAVAVHVVCGFAHRPKKLGVAIAVIFYSIKETGFIQPGCLVDDLCAQLQAQEASVSTGVGSCRETEAFESFAQAFD
ncbi:hypothetical protein GZ78_05600 [Endozoicomonas numazuensis]|uniref:Uncharacterized protein n=1 Tax=Endozoicomonas numazuensis TaxID=1137799 RepID=A0A081NLV1_9GAMM|nr:hypothetical protein GZ78_05600 [Endozoicomonas numazuensis]